MHSSTYYLEAHIIDDAETLGRDAFNPVMFLKVSWDVFSFAQNITNLCCSLTGYFISCMPTFSSGIFFSACVYNITVQVRQPSCLGLTHLTLHYCLCTRPIND